MGIRFKRQGGGTSSSATAKAPTSLGYGEPAVDSEGRLYIGSGKGQVVSRVKVADTCTKADSATTADTADYATRAKFHMPLYSITLKVDEWSLQNDGRYGQVPDIVAVDGGPNLPGNGTVSPPMAKPTGVKETDELLQETLNIINAGTTSFGSTSAIVKVWEKPETDITVYYYAR